MINSFRRYIGGNLLPGEVNRLTVLKKQGLSSMTWNNKVAYMRAIFNHVFLHDLVALKNNPFNGVIVRPDVKRKKH